METHHWTWKTTCRQHHHHHHHSSAGPPSPAPSLPITTTLLPDIDYFSSHHWIDGRTLFWKIAASDFYHHWNNDDSVKKKSRSFWKRQQKNHASMDTVFWFIYVHCATVRGACVFPSLTLCLKLLTLLFPRLMACLETLV